MAMAGCVKQKEEDNTTVPSEEVTTSTEVPVDTFDGAVLPGDAPDGAVLPERMIFPCMHMMRGSSTAGTSYSQNTLMSRKPGSTK